LREWYTPSELAALPGVPTTERRVRAQADREQWQSRARAGRGGGREYHISALPAKTRAALLLRAQKLEGTPPVPNAPSTGEADELRRASMWRAYDAKPATQKRRAVERVRAVAAVEQLTRDGTDKMVAYATVAAQIGKSATSVRNWCRDAARVDVSDRAAALAPRYVGGTRRREYDERLWQLWMAFYARQEAPTAEASYRDLERAAIAEGFTSADLPSKSTLVRRFEKLPEEVKVYARRGPEAVKQLMPALRRDHSVFHALEAVNADQHTWDVFVQWPDGKIARPISVAWQDIYSGKLLAIRWARTVDAYLVRLTLGDVIERYGIPQHAWVDNGREFNAKELTGGVEHRFRFKITPEEPFGVFATLGVQLHLTQPYNGRGKPIERAHNDFAHIVAKDPAFAGAYTGHNPVSKPENYGSRAVPLAEFVAVATQQIAHLNAMPGRRSPVCRGRSFDDVFGASYAASPVCRATAEQRRLWLLQSRPMTVSPTGSITLYENTYWSEQLTALRGKRVLARFDPERLHDEPAHVYTLDGVWLCEAPVWAPVGFADVASGKEYARQQRTRTRAARELLDAERRVDALDAARRRAPAPTESLPNAGIVRPVFGAATPSTFAPTPAAAARAMQDADDGVDEITASVLAFVSPQLADLQRRPA
jgi:putative transposase